MSYMNSMDTTGEVPEWLTAGQVAPMLDRTERGIWALWRTGQLAGYKLGHRSVRFIKADVLAYIDSHRVEASR